MSCSVFFFFQAEDGIRDIGVTGVQTCALPISATLATLRARKADGLHGGMAFTYRNPERSTDPSRAIGGEGRALVGAESGRAAGRGRGESSGVAASLKKKKRTIVHYRSALQTLE